MTSTPGAGWFPDPSRRFDLRYWDGSAWTEHVTKDRAQSVDPDGALGATAPAISGMPDIKPGPVAVWITAVFSLLRLTIFTGGGATSVRLTVGVFFGTEPEGASTVAIPLGLMFAVFCWLLVARARQDSEEKRVPLPSSYNTARILAAVFAAFTTLTAIVQMAA
jgi:hypothetical protein